MLCGTTGLRFPAVGLASCGAAAAAAAGAGAGGCNLRYVWWQDEKSESFLSCPQTRSLSPLLSQAFSSLGSAHSVFCTEECQHPFVSLIISCDGSTHCLCIV